MKMSAISEKHQQQQLNMPIMLLKRPEPSSAPAKVPAETVPRESNKAAPLAAASQTINGKDSGVDSERLSDALVALQLKSEGKANPSLKELKDGRSEEQASGNLIAVPTAEDQATEGNDGAISGKLNDVDGGASGTSQPPLREAPAGGELLEAQAPPMDLALKDALGSGRDRPFVLKIESEMVSFLQDQSRQLWELPLMNSYQRLLVHRLANRFALVHSVDTHTKAVFLAKTPSSFVPTLLPSSRANPSVCLDPELPHSATESVSGATSATSSTPARPQAFKIMRRDPSVSTTRSHSPHLSDSIAGDDIGPSGSGSAASVSAGGSGKQGPAARAARKDRKHMTIEEREAAYREARERIFQGFNPDEAAAKTNSGVQKGKTRESPEGSMFGQQQNAAFYDPALSGRIHGDGLGHNGGDDWPGLTRRSVRTKASLRPSAPAFDPMARTAGVASTGVESSRSSASSMSPISPAYSQHAQQQWHPLHQQNAQLQYSHGSAPHGGYYQGAPQPGYLDPAYSMQQIQPPQGMYQAGVMSGVPVFAVSQPLNSGMSPGAMGGSPHQFDGHLRVGPPGGAGYGGNPQGYVPQAPGWQPPQANYIPSPGYLQQGFQAPHGKRHEQDRFGSDFYPGQSHRSRSSPSGLSTAAAEGRGSSRSSSIASGLELGAGYRKSPSHDTASVVSSSSASSRSSKPGSGASSTSHPLPARPDWVIGRPPLTSRTSFGSSTSSIAPSASVSVNGAAESISLSSADGQVASVSPRSAGTASPSSRSAGTASPTSASRSVSACASVGLRSEASTPPVHESPTASKHGDSDSPA